MILASMASTMLGPEAKGMQETWWDRQQAPAQMTVGRASGAGPEAGLPTARVCTAAHPGDTAELAS